MQLVRYPLESFFRRQSTYQGAQVSKASTPLASPVDRAEDQWHTREFTKTGSALGASIVHASQLFGVDAPSPQAAGGHSCEGSDPNRRKPPLPQPFPHCRLFKSKKHLSCRDIRTRITRLDWKAGMNLAQYSSLMDVFEKATRCTGVLHVEEQDETLMLALLGYSRRPVPLPQHPLFYKPDLRTCRCNLVLTRSMSRSRSLMLYNRYTSEEKGRKATAGFQLSRLS